ncbi:phosphoribosylanthranilate isomerase [Marilutibacter aestuarii]|uniref:N-(5'-phosphoribosyl)anthranilate isomerase n=1 Tax=Marilutibacter aestuarii TaxID=1706195 RepID=A0A508A990_9GAMM|nr:phosphoribosylanthranilate isomerase [Lysobacter aestuarii]TQD45433.1 phosphoribosylanthranilate isomerase [Lysobacter aestuarii]
MERSHLRTRIKFCGLTRPGDVRLACELGVDAIGFVFAQRSRRRVEPEQARLLRQALAPMVSAVALFMDTPADDVRRVVRIVGPHLLQFHGSEDDAWCRQFGVPYLKAIAMGGSTVDRGEDALFGAFPGASGFLLDSHASGEAGGSGHAFDWATVPTGLSRPALLAGGLSPDNVHAAIEQVAPWGVDVSSGIESAPGLKDGERMRRFVEEVRRADLSVRG